MEILPILIKTVAGAGGGWLGNMLKQNGLGMLGNLVAGGVGGNLLPLATSALGLFGGGDNMIVNILTSLVGGGLGSLLWVLFKKA